MAFRTWKRPKNKTKDYLRRNKIFSEKIAADLKLHRPPPEEIDIDLSAANIQDSQLKMMFAICHPAIPAEARIGLSLRILCGFGIEEIAATFLTGKETINKRLFRAKEKLRTEKINIELPEEADIAQRLDNVLTTIYLLFNEGYYSTTQHQVLRKELCLEAMRLNYFLLENTPTNTPAVNALMSLMCFHASRFEARTSDSGAYILYEEQDRSLPASMMERRCNILPALCNWQKRLPIKILFRNTCIKSGAIPRVNSLFIFGLTVILLCQINQSFTG
ncbi:RNA polymerase sigma factor [Chitinophaga sp. ARDCPP14]|uniref:RNA polymerase sigma factor n=1 Tax=Chitinophaga sp. ARDCPP14 TaxID=3391139 RepID=UPI003F526537